MSKQQVLTILIKGSNISDVSSREQVQTPFMIYNTERHICSEDLNNLDKDTMSVESKGSDKVASDDTSVLDNLYNGTTGLGPLQTRFIFPRNLTDF